MSLVNRFFVFGWLARRKKVFLNDEKKLQELALEASARLRPKPYEIGEILELCLNFEHFNPI